MKLSTSREGQSLEGYHSTNPILKKMQDVLCQAQGWKTFAKFTRFIIECKKYEQTDINTENLCVLRVVLADSHAGFILLYP